MIQHDGFLTNKRAGFRTGIAQRSLVFHLVLVAFLVAETLAGSRMVEPPTRPSLWRYGFGTPVNFNDDEIKCGGFDRQYGANDGKCGVCGDPWTDPTPRRYEAGGTGTATPTPLPVRVYNKGSDIFVAIDSSSDLVGKYEFRICKLNSSNQTPDQSCFDATPLPIKEAELGLSYRIGQSGGLTSLHLVLPANLVCSHCLLQWRHVTGNRVGSESCVQCSATSTPQCNFCLGCGNQSWYQGCSDIAVIDTGGTHPAVLGVKSNSELKQQWQDTLQEIKDNCTCTASPGGENLINGSYP